MSYEDYTYPARCIELARFCPWLGVLCFRRVFNPFTPPLSLIVAKMNLLKRSAPYWSNPYNFWHSGTLAHSTERHARMSKIRKGELDQYGPAHFEV